MIGDSICYLIACQYCRQCHVSSGQCLSDAHDVRFHSGMFPGKEFAGASESCGYFVEDQEDIVLLCRVFPLHADTAGDKTTYRLLPEQWVRG